MNNIPYYYDDVWKKHEIDYLKFNDYKFIKDLSYTKDKSKSIILLFNYNGNNVLRGYTDGILFPQLNYFNIENLHIKKKEKKIQDVFNYLLNIFEEYNIVDTKIYDNPYLCKSMGYSIFNLINLKGFTLKSRLDIYFESTNNENIETEMESGGSRTIINGFNKNKPEFKIYFGEIDDNIFNSFATKHFELACKKTKSDLCWNLMKEMIQDKKALLIVSDNNYVLYFISNSYCYYAINACTKQDKIVTFLLYEGIKWLTANNYKFIHFGPFYKYYDDDDDEKNRNICKFKHSLCNKMYTQYYLEKN